MSAFDSDSQFEEFLKRMKEPQAGATGPEQYAHFIARNFLLEERLDPLRRANYLAQLAGGAPANIDEWHGTHTDYLRDHVFLTPHKAHDYRIVDRNDLDVCPETFRAPTALIS